MKQFTVEILKKNNELKPVDVWVDDETAKVLETLDENARQDYLIMEHKKLQSKTMTKTEIKGDLVNIRMYYLDYDFFKNWEKRGVGSSVRTTVEKYNKLMENAPLNLFRVYLGMYCQGQTQAEIADDLGYSEHQVYVWHNQLFQYLQNAMG